MSIRIKARGDRFEVDIRWKDAAGVKHRERVISRLSTKSAVRRWAEDRERYVVRHGKPQKPAPGTDDAAGSRVPTCAEFWPRFLEQYVHANRQKPSEVRSKESIWRTHLQPAIGHKALDAVTTGDVQALKARLADRRPKTTNNILAVIATMLRQAVKWGVVAAMPCEVVGVKVPDREMDYYEPADYDAVVTAAAAISATTYLAVLLAGDAGLRAGEIRALRWRDVDLKRRQIRVQQAEWRGHVEAPKGWQSRLIPMTARLLAALSGHRHLRHERVLVHHDGEPLTEKVLRVLVERAIARAAVAESARPVHRLRHTFGTRLASLGATPKQIQVLMGHKHLSTTQRYMHLSPSSRDQAIRLLDGEGVGEASPTEKRKP